ncbi:hypothetical protein Taro_029725 [Colocasia esculenta]|uniref:Uncharacterized protein n=1 Tax=Colocasia esculenta TaxID=4460 RepID=A0A843VJN4_COLES|nr:hypothetical protein [Colocasia esculenta]
MAIFLGIFGRLRMRLWGGQHIDGEVFVRAHLPSYAPPVSSFGPSWSINAEQSNEEERPSGPLSEDLTGPLGPKVVEDVHMANPVMAVVSGPPGPAEDALGPSGHDSVAARAEEPAIVSHLVVYEVCKHRRKCLAKTVFLSRAHIPLCFIFSPRSSK